MWYLSQHFVLLSLSCRTLHLEQRGRQLHLQTLQRPFTYFQACVLLHRSVYPGVWVARARHGGVGDVESWPPLLGREQLHNENQDGFFLGWSSQYSFQAAATDKFTKFVVNGKYHFSPLTTGLKEPSSLSIMSTPPIPLLYAWISWGSDTDWLGAPRTRRRTFLSGPTFSWLLPMQITRLSDHLHINTFPWHL